MRLYRLSVSRVALLYGMLFMFAGCNGDNTVQFVTGQNTPQETIKKAAESLRSKNLDNHLETVRCSERQREFAIATFELHTACELQEALVARFGDGAWEEFQNVDLSPEFRASFGYMVPPLGDEWLENLEIEINGDRATWICKWGRRPVEQYFVFDGKQNAWFLEIPGLPEEEDRIEAACEFPRKLAEAARVGLKVINEPNITIREIKLRMADILFKRSHEIDQ